MPGSFAILFPAPYIIEVSKLRQQLDAAHFAWAQLRRLQQQAFVIENIRFNHDPLWNKRVLSLQSARDGAHWFWKATRVIATISGGSI
ncbi:MAG: hypothetical protein WA702_20865 [Bradyrhizobium sp.]|jgi:hypothetical protein|uniref:hypothetical protein n=1 Tax=Bradyrhizobium sp. TaxID=376 RepID=UPI003C7A6220